MQSFKSSFSFWFENGFTPLRLRSYSTLLVRHVTLNRSFWYAVLDCQLSNGSAKFLPFRQSILQRRSIPVLLGSWNIFPWHNFIFFIFTNLRIEKLENSENKHKTQHSIRQHTFKRPCFQSTFLHFLYLAPFFFHRSAHAHTCA